MESWWTPKISESDCRGQTSMDCGVLYINGKLLKRRCLKWARITHLDICNTSYGQKKGRESNCQFDSRPQKVVNRHFSDVRFGSATWVGKLSTRATTLLQTASRPKVCSQSYGAPKSRESHLAQFRESCAGVPGKIAIWMWAPWRVTEYTIRGKVVASPSPGCGESCVSVLPMARPSTKGAPTLH
jgi:hypothetical protein